MRVLWPILLLGVSLGFSLSCSGDEATSAPVHGQGAAAGTAGSAGSAGSYTPGGAGSGTGGNAGSGGSAAAGAGGQSPTDGGGAGGAGADGGGALDGGTDGAVVPPVASCPDPSEKSCDGAACVKPNPVDGCSLTDCDPCDEVANGYMTCGASQCSFGCNPGFVVSAGACAAVVVDAGPTDGGSSDAGTDANADASVEGGPTSSCSDGVTGGSETDVDCGGAECPACNDLETCQAGSDCVSGVCTASTCRPARCDDGVRNALETDVDCGGNCVGCEPGGSCSAAADCDRGPCDAGVCGCTPYSCTSAAVAGQCGPGTDDDCGGTLTCFCASGETCNQGQCCDPQAVCQTTCGLTDDGCGGTIDCALLPCSSGQVCNAGSCCAPDTCPTGACGSVSNGCGGQVACGGCSGGQVCVANACQCDGTDSDGDGQNDCTEADDGDPWTDPDVFNGLVGGSFQPCHSESELSSGGCAIMDSMAELDACTSGSASEQLNLTAGWDFGSTDQDICDGDYGFSPEFNQNCGDDSFAVEYTGFMNLQAGRNCFQIDGVNQGGASCATFILDGNDSQVVTHDSSGAVCFDVQTSGGHAVRLYFQRTNNGDNMSLSWLHCFGDQADCTPSAAVSPSALKVSN